VLPTPLTVSCYGQFSGSRRVNPGVAATASASEAGYSQNDGVVSVHSPSMTLAVASPGTLQR
jgi:hypothetical protein